MEKTQKKTDTLEVNTLESKRKISIKSPELYFDKIMAFFRKTENKLAFLVTLISGLIVHFQLYSQELTNPDGLWNSVYYKADIWEASLGRWGIRFIDTIRMGLVSPIVSTFISILVMSFATILLVKLLKIKSKVAIVIVSIAMSAMPAFVDILTYWYCSDSYTLSIFISILAVYLIFDGPFKKKRNNLFLASMCLCFALSIYQAQIGVITALCVFRTIIDILEDNKTAKEVIKQLAYCLLMGVIGAIVYYIISKILLKFLGIPFANYGWSDMNGLENVKNLLPSIKNTYVTFFEYYFKDGIVRNLKWKRQYLNLALGLLSAISIFIIVFKNRIYRKKVNIIILILAFMIIPICLGSITIISPSNGMIIRMSVQYILPIIFAIALIDLINTKKENGLKENLTNIIKILICAVTILINFTYFLSDNATYMAIKRTHDQAYSYVVRVVDRIETNEEYKKGMTLMLAGIIDKSEYPMDYKIYTMANGGASDCPAFWNSYAGSTSIWKRFLNNYLGMSVTLCEDNDYNKILETQEFKEMGIFPEKNSVKVINEIMVVKFSENPPRYE